MKSTMKYIITTSSFVTLHCFRRFVLMVVQISEGIHMLDYFKTRICHGALCIVQMSA